MCKTMVARPINGITLNGELEFLLDDGGEAWTFDSEEQARAFLIAADVGSEELRHMVFIEKK